MEISWTISLLFSFVYFSGAVAQVRRAEVAYSQYKKEIQNIELEFMQPRIMNGAPANSNEFRYMAALGYNITYKDGTNGIEYGCAGSVISPRYILTAAHCVTGEPLPVEVRLGSVHLFMPSASAQHIRIGRLIPHPNYSRNYNLYDIALLELGKPIRWTLYIQPIFLSTKALEFGLATADEMYIVTGWGRKGDNKSQSETLLKTAPLTLVSARDCEPFYPLVLWEFVNGLRQHSFCAIDRNRRTDSCQGDSGGPLVHITTAGDILVGVTSFGYPPCGTSIPGVYMSVLSFLDWIEEIVWL